MRSRVWQISKEWFLLLWPLRFSLLQEAQHTIREVFGRIEPFLGDIRNLLVVDLFRTFGIEWRQKLHGGSVVFQERFVEICEARSSL